MKKKLKMATRNAKPKGRPKAAARRKTVIHRVNRHGANGSIAESTEVAPEKVSVGEAVRRAVEALGDVVIDESLAPQKLRELGDCYERVAEEQARYDAKAEEAKTAKKSLESAQNFLLERVKAFTHPAPLPLFDQAEREADQADMEAAAGAEELGLAEVVQ